MKVTLKLNFADPVRLCVSCASCSSRYRFKNRCDALISHRAALDGHDACGRARAVDALKGMKVIEPLSTVTMHAKPQATP